MPNGRNLDLDISGQGGADIQMQVEMGGEGSASNAEAWAVGERHGVPVGSSDPTYHNNSRYYAEQTATDAHTASGAASSAEHDASNAEAYSVGKRGGTDVDSSDPAYHNNAKYYNEQAGASAYAAGQAQSAAEATLTKQPKIENGTWWIWNATTSAYVNTNVKATGDAWHVVKTYASVAAMEADYSGTDTHIGDYVMVVNTVEDPDNAKVYIKGNLMWEFVVDMSGATGIQGPAGANAYVHIKFSATQPTQNSDMKNQPDAWIGIYSGNSASAPTAYTSYTWYKIKGDTGETGQTGPSGTSYYVHIKYADQQPTNNADMKTTPSAWIGIYAGTSATAPSAYTNYVWYKYKGEIGQTGATGNGISSITLNNDYTLTILYTNGTSTTTSSIRGATGATPQLSIGTVETVAASEGAAASLSGTAEAPVLNLQIPRGVAGNESIDDTAGIGDDDVVWSADKTKTELHKKAPIIEETISTPAEVVTIPDGAGGIPVKQLRVAVEPVQDLHGYSNPWPAGSTKNKLPLPVAETHDGITCVRNADGSITLSGTPTANTYFDYFPGNFDSTAFAGYKFVATGSDNLEWGNSKLRNRISGSNRVSIQEINGSGTIVDNGTGLYFGIRIPQSYSIPTGGVTIYPMLIAADASTDWEPYENICPITGWTGANVAVAGRNLIPDGTNTNNGYVEDAYLDSSGNAIANGVWNVSEYFRVEENTNYCISDAQGKTSNAVHIIFYDRAKNIISGSNYDSSPKVITSPANAAFARMSIADATSTRGPTQIEKGSIATDYNSPAHIIAIALPQAAGTVYGGTLTVNEDGTGTLMVNRKEFIFDGSSDENWVKASNNEYFRTDIEAKYVNTAVICDKFKQETTVSAKIGVNIVNNSQFRLRYTLETGKSVSDCESFLSSNPIQVILTYLPEYVQTYQLTSLEVIQLLKGSNIIFADTGDILSVTYSADTRLYIDNGNTEQNTTISAIRGMLGPEEEETATSNHSVDDVFVCGNKLYKATASIATGDTIAETGTGANVTEITLVDLFNSILPVSGVSF